MSEKGKNSQARIMSAREYFSRAQILAMPQDKRCSRVTACNARDVGLIVIDAVGGLPLWMGTPDEDQKRITAFRRGVGQTIKVDWSHNDTGM
jgi:hypothetical protein